MRIRSIETFKITLPFRFAFGHSLATRAESRNLIVKVTLANGICGYGESVPRDYVTGETVEQAEDNVLLNYTPALLKTSFEDPSALVRTLNDSFMSMGLDDKMQGASWCALELAFLDACSRLHEMPLHQLIGTRKLEKIRYGGTVPFGKKKALQAILTFYKVYGFETVKLKVGAQNLEDDVEKVKLARKILGPHRKIRVDANCAWNLQEAQKAAEAFRPYNVLSYEQPLPATNWDDLKKLSESIEEEVLLDESLCTLKQAKELAENKICDAFNVRVSKAGGIFASQRMIDIAQNAKLKVHLGAQVGESGILSAAARQLALTNQKMENYEGSANFFLLKKDICRENLNAGPGGFGDLRYARKTAGTGINIVDSCLSSMTESSDDCQSDAITTPRVQNQGSLSPKAR